MRSSNYWGPGDVRWWIVTATAAPKIAAIFKAVVGPGIELAFFWSLESSAND